MITQISKRLHRLNSYDNIYVICFLICVISILISGCAEKSDEDTARIETPELEQKILSFNLANYEEDGSKKWELKGDSANVMTDIIYLANILVDIHEEPQIKPDNYTYQECNTYQFGRTEAYN